MNHRSSSIPRRNLLAASLLLPFAFMLCGCDAAGRMALSYGLHCGDQSSQVQPQSAQGLNDPQDQRAFSPVPNQLFAAHRHAAARVNHPPALVETPHHSTRIEARHAHITEISAVESQDFQTQ